MNERVAFERVGEDVHAFVHEEAVHGPFKEGREYDRHGETNRCPEAKD
jgi:hypothetical protein